MGAILRNLFFTIILLCILFVPFCIVSVTMFSDDQGRPFGIDVSPFVDGAFGWLYWIDENWFDYETNADRNLRECGKVLCD